MEKQMSKGKMVLFLAALFLTNVALMADMVIIPAADGLFKTFQNVTAVNFILSGPSLICVFSALPCGKLMQYMGKKTLLIIGFSLFTVGSIFGGMFENLSYIIAMRCLVGISVGIVNSTAMALIAEIFVEENKRSTIMGIYNAAMAGTGAVIGLIAGYFAVESWRAVFKVYWVSIPILILILLFIPQTAPEGVPSSQDKENSSRNKTYIPHLLALCLSQVAYNVIYGVVYFQIAVYVVETQIGNESVAGILSSLGTVGSCIACMAFGFTYSKLKRGAITAGYCLLTLCYIVLFFAPNVVVAGIACTIMGSSYGHGFSYFFMRCTVIVPPEKTSTTISLITAIGGLGLFLSTYAVTFIQKIMNQTTIAGIIPLLIVLAGAGAVLSFILALRNKKSPSEYGAAA